MEIGKILKVIGDDAVSVDVGGVVIDAELFRTSGDASTPVVGDTVVLGRLGGARKQIVVAYYDDKVTPTASGGRVMYSRSADGEVKSTVELTPDGDILLNGSSKTLVTGDELADALDTFTTALNTALAAKLDGAGAIGTLQININSAKTTTLKTGG